MFPKEINLYFVNAFQRETDKWISNKLMPAFVFAVGSILGGKCSATCSVSHAECDDSQDPVCVCSPGYYNKDETCESSMYSDFSVGSLA